MREGGGRGKRGESYRMLIMQIGRQGENEGARMGERGESNGTNRMLVMQIDRRTRGNREIGEVSQHKCACVLQDSRLVRSTGSRFFISHILSRFSDQRNSAREMKRRLPGGEVGRCRNLRCSLFWAHHNLLHNPKANLDASTAEMVEKNALNVPA